MTMPTLASGPAPDDGDVLPLSVEDIKLQVVGYLLAYAYQPLVKEMNGHDNAIAALIDSAAALTSFVLGESGNTQ